MTTEDAQALVDQDRRERSQRAAEAIAEVLKRENCDLVAAPQITADGRLTAVVQLIAK